MILGIAVLLICVGLSGCNEQTAINHDDNIEYTQEEIYQKLMNNKIGVSTISEILDATIDLWNSIGGNAYSYGGYATPIEGDLWEVGVYINADEVVTKYSWQYNTKTDMETPLSSSAKMLYESEDDEGDDDVDESETYDVQIIEESINKISSDYLVAVGKVKNNDVVNIFDVGIECTLFDASDNVIERQTTTATPLILEPQSTNYFIFWFETDYYDHYNLDITGMESTFLEPLYDYLQISNVNAEYDMYDYVITCDVENTANKIAKYVTVYALVYDSNDNPLYMGFSYGDYDDMVLYSGQKKQFEITILTYEWAKQIDDYELKISCIFDE